MRTSKRSRSTPPRTISTGLRERSKWLSEPAPRDLKGRVDRLERRIRSIQSILRGMHDEHIDRLDVIPLTVALRGCWIELLDLDEPKPRRKRHAPR
jgi:hypothetical protein